MRNNFKLILIVLGFIFSFGPQPAFAKSLGSNELLKDAKQYDGKVITYSGEAIGDIMRRGEFVWVNIHDGDNAVGVWVNTALAKGIDFTGTYKSVGDTVEVYGVFHRACLEHGGDLDIHAQTLRKITAGKIIEHKADFFKVKLILILLGALLLVWILSLFKRK